MIRTVLLVVGLSLGGCDRTASESAAPSAAEPTVPSAALMPVAEAADVAWIAKDGFCEPETVLPLPDGTLLISNVCDFRQSGSGYLSLLSGDGEVVDMRVVDRLDSPLGMALRDATLYVVDANRVRTYRWPEFEALETITLDTQVANDIAVAADGTIYVTDTARGNVVRRRPGGAVTVLGGDGRFPGANGIELHDQYLYVGGQRLWRMHLASEVIDTLGPEWLADIDGIEFEGDGTLQVTPVGGPLVRQRGNGTFQVLGGEGVSSANHGYAQALRLALIPTGYDNTIIAIRIPTEPVSGDDR